MRSASGVGEWVDEDGVDDAEDGTGGADAEGEREDGRENEAGALAEFAGGVLEVGEERLHVGTSRGGGWALRRDDLDEIWLMRLVDDGSGGRV